MATFDNESLFDSGTVRFKIGPVKLRHAIQHAPGSIGAMLDNQGLEARRIVQSGKLVADTPVALQGLADAIRAKLDGRSYTLVDNLGRAWSDTAMIEFEMDPFTRIGARWKSAYRITYLQVIP